MIKIKQEYDEGVSGKWYHGMTYYDYERRKVIAYVIPLNWFVWIGRQIWFRLRLPPRDWTSGFYDIAYKKGKEDAWKEIESIRAKIAQKMAIKIEKMAERDFLNPDDESWME